MNKEYFLSINEVSARLELPAHTLRYWEKQFPAAIKPTTGAGGRRYYRPETVETLELIRDHLYNRGMTIAGVKKMIREGTLVANTDPIVGDALADKKASVAAALSNDGSALFSSRDDIKTAIDLLERAKKELKN